VIVNPRYASHEHERAPETAKAAFCDEVSGLRYYNPTQGRFINRDPIEEQGGMNIYAAFRNDPASSIDLLGLIDCPCKHKPAASRCAKLKEKYGKAIDAEKGAYFDSLTEAQQAMYINAYLGQKADFEYGSHIIDNWKLHGSQEGPHYYVTPTFSNFMVGEGSISNANLFNPDVIADIDFDRDPAFIPARGELGKITIPGGGVNALGGTKMLGYPNSALIESAHSHPTEHGFSGGDISYSIDNNIPFSAVLPSGLNERVVPGEAPQWDNSAISARDLRDLKCCFGEGRQ
jgi:RHS repeat-associated protein